LATGTLITGNHWRVLIEATSWRMGFQEAGGLSALALVVI
jgi:hypothetical protein